MSKREQSTSPARKPDIARALPQVAIIGAGRLGTAVAIAISRVGYPITAVVSRTARNAHRARTLVIKNTHTTHQGQVLLALDAAHLDAIPPCDLYIFATPDDDICDAAARLAAVYQNACKRSRKRPIAIHLSGARTHHELDSLRVHNFLVGSCHPLISVSHPVKGSGDLPGAYFALEGDQQAVAVARRFVKAIGGQVIQLDTAHKTLYHLAAVMTSGHTVALLATAIDLLERCGIDRSTAQKILLPLLQSTVQNLSVHTPAQALTGSFARFDKRTIEDHIASLSTLIKHDETVPDVRCIYSLLGKRSLELALEQKNASVSTEVAREIELMLEAAIYDK